MTSPNPFDQPSDEEEEHPVTSPNPFDQPSDEEEEHPVTSPNPFDQPSDEEEEHPVTSPNPFDQPSDEEEKPAVSSNPFDQPSDEHPASTDSFTQPAEDHTAPVNEPSVEPANPFDQPSVEPAASQPADSLFDLTPAQPANDINSSAQTEAPQAASPNLFGASPVKTETTATPAQEDPMAFDFSSVVAETEKANKPSLWRRSENEERR